MRPLIIDMERRGPVSPNQMITDFHQLAKNPHSKSYKILQPQTITIPISPSVHQATHFHCYIYICMCVCVFFIYLMWFVDVLNDYHKLAHWSTVYRISFWSWGYGQLFQERSPCSRESSFDLRWNAVDRRAMAARNCMFLHLPSSNQTWLAGKSSIWWKF